MGDLKDIGGLKDLPDTSLRISRGFNRYMVNEMELLHMVVGEGGDYISDFIRRANLFHSFRIENILDEEAMKLLSLIGYTHRLGNKEFIRLQDGRFLVFHDLEYLIYNFQPRKCKFCDHDFAWKFCGRCYKDQGDNE